VSFARIPRVSDVTFSFDLGSPYAWLAAERVDDAFAPREVVWEPVLLGGLFAATGRSSWARAGDVPRAAGIAEIERRARDRGLPPVVWPDPWPGDYLLAMRVATAVLRAGGQEGLRRFALAAFRVAFTEGADLSGAKGLGAAADRAGLPGPGLLIAAADRATKDALRATTEAAVARGLRGVPTFTVDGTVHFGDDHLDAAAAAPAPGA
jgi:2-hydroxychromene-2-carboxylate isomerase